MKGLEGVYREIIRARSEKFLGFFEINELILLEKLLGTDLGVSSREKPRERRPFIGWMADNTFNLCFLTSDGRSRRPVDLGNCRRINEKCRWIKEESYLFWDYRRKAFTRYVFKGVELSYILCGRCEDLEFLDSLRAVEP